MSTEVQELLLSLGQLAERHETIPFSKLYRLSDLAGEEMTDFRAAWADYPVDQRRRVTHALAELAEASFEVNFDAIFRFCLDDGDEQVRATAIDGLWENEEPSLVGPLLTMLRSDPSVLVRSAAASGLGRFVLAGELEQLDAPIQARIIADLLTTAHLAGESVQVRRRAVESVAYACLPEVLDTLEMAYYDDDDQMRQSAVVGMGRSCDRRWAEIILSELESNSAPMRYEAALACGELWLRAALPRLARLLDDPDREVRDATIWALGQIGGAEARDLLLAAYDDADESTRLSLDEALAEEAFVSGDLDFMVYEMDEELEDELADDDDDDELYALWTADDSDPDEPDIERW